MEISNSLQPGALVTLSAGIYWYHEQRIDDLTGRPLLLLGFEPKNIGIADGSIMDRGNRSGIANLLIDGVPRTIWIHGNTMTALEV
jgi:hypothetical protein